MTAREVVQRFWEGMPPGHPWHPYRRLPHNAQPADVRMEFVDFVDMLARDGHITEHVAANVTLDSGRRKRT